MRYQKFRPIRLSASMFRASRHLRKSWRQSATHSEEYKDFGRWRGWGTGKELCCNLCSKNCWSFIRVEVGIKGEVQAELIMRFYLSWSRKNQRCSLFPHKCSRGQNPVTFLTQITLTVIILKQKLYQRFEILAGKALPRETRRTHIRLQQSIEFRAS